MDKQKDLEELKTRLKNYIAGANKALKEFDEEVEAILEESRRKKLEELGKKIKSNG